MIKWSPSKQKSVKYDVLSCGTRNHFLEHLANVHPQNTCWNNGREQLMRDYKSMDDISSKQNDRRHFISWNQSILSKKEQ